MKHKETILIVDDEEINRKLLGKLFDFDYQVKLVGDGKEALEYISANYASIAVVLLDIIMPVIDGFKVLEFLNRKGITKNIPIMLVTGDKAVDVKVKGYDLGAVDIIHKPFHPDIIRKRVENIIELYQYKHNLELLVKEQTKELEDKNKRLLDMNDRVMEIMSELVEFRDLESGEHVKRVKEFTRILATNCADLYPEYHLDQEKISMISSVSMLHDIGKIAIPDSILLKPGKLTTEEFDLMKSHTTKGCEIIKSISELQEKKYDKLSYEICRYHHERYDGNGYPDGLTGEEIPIAAQLVSIADVYDALTSDRVYKEAYSKEQAYTMIKEGECGAFSEKILDVFDKSRDEMEVLSDKITS